MHLKGSFEIVLQPLSYNGGLPTRVPCIHVLYPKINSCWEFRVKWPITKWRVVIQQWFSESRNPCTFALFGWPLKKLPMNEHSTKDIHWGISQHNSLQCIFSIKNHLATTKQGQILIKLGTPRIRANLEHVKDLSFEFSQMRHLYHKVYPRSSNLFEKF
jgi:hypothetical protein